MSTIIDTYKGNLEVNCVHKPDSSNVRVVSKMGDLGMDNSFSPTDLVAAALGACALNVMGSFAERHNIDIKGATAEIIKESQPNLGPIASIIVTFHMPAGNYSEKEKKALQNCVNNCPVHKSLDAKVEQKMIFDWQ